MFSWDIWTVKLKNIYLLANSKSGHFQGIFSHSLFQNQHIQTKTWFGWSYITSKVSISRPKSIKNWFSTIDFSTGFSFNSRPFSRSGITSSPWGWVTWIFFHPPLCPDSQDSWKARDQSLRALTKDAVLQQLLTIIDHLIVVVRTEPKNPRCTLSSPFFPLSLVRSLEYPHNSSTGQLVEIRRRGNILKPLHFA